MVTDIGDKIWKIADVITENTAIHFFHLILLYLILAKFYSELW